MEKKEALNQKTCVPCKKGGMPLKSPEIQTLLGQLKEGWKAIEERCIEKEYSFPNFVKALDFTNRVGALAEKEGHHPDIYLSYGKVKIQLWTHKISGLSENDFILAAKCDLL